MNIKEARAAIEAILDAIPDSELPKFDKIEPDEKYGAVAWWGGHGYHLGSAKRNGKRDPENYRRGASWSAIEQEMVYRADLKYLANGDALAEAAS